MQKLTTITDYIRYAASEFARANLYYGHGTTSALDDAAALVLGLLDLPYDLNVHYFSARLTDSERETVHQGIRRRIDERLPVPYITQKTLFGGEEFYIDQRALIPRSPIAELIRRDFSPWWTGDMPDRILDLCCGSGCLGILAKCYQPQAEVILSDIDSQALEVCAINVDKFNFNNDSLSIIESDLYSQIDGQFDWIICNPPYVEAAEMTDIPPEYHHEPAHALVSGADGLALTRLILQQSAQYLSENGLLILEVGMTWHLLEEAYPDIDFDWVGFEYGGEGVCIIGADELKAWQLAGLL